MSFFARAVLPYFLLFCFLCIDLWFFFTIGSAIPLFLLSFFCATLFMHPPSKSTSLWALLLFMSASQTMGLSIWWPLITVAPFCLIIPAIQNHIFNHLLYPAAIAGLCVAIDLLALRPLLLGKTLPPIYTMGVIFSTLIATTVFSLKLKTGKTGQSLTLG
jgi:hypothetical protein